jgi:glycosyltransferase involved in cell wall biosynthesis
MEKKRNVLMIAHYFPPGTSSGTLRTVKFAKYLPECGWQPFVLTMQPYAYHRERRDTSLLEELSPDLKVYRTPVWMPDRFLARLKNRLTGRISRPDSGATAVSAANGISPQRPGVADHVRDWLQFPDAYGGWLIPGYWRARQVMRADKIDLIYSTAPSPVAHMIAMWLKKWTGAPWVADFRDPWECLFPESVYVGPQHPWRQSAEVAVAEKVVRSADLIVANTSRLCDAFCERFPELDRRKFITIPNGFDGEDFRDLQPKVSAGGPFTISHTGTFFGSLRSPDEVLTAIRQLVCDGRMDPAALSVKLIGCGSFKASHAPYLQIVPRVSHRESLQIMADSDVLLLLQQSPKYWLQVPAKTYEYIAARRWILAVTPEGATRDIVAPLPNGVVAAPEHPDELKAAILGLYRRYCERMLYPVPVDTESIRRYTRREQSRNLAAHFSELIRSRLSLPAAPVMSVG